MAMSAPADAFAVPRNETRAMRAVTALDVLKMADIPFPEGSSANYNPALNELIVRNLPENQEKVANYVMAIAEKIPLLLSCTVHVVQADAKTLRGIAEQTRRLTDQSAAWQTVEDAAAQGRAKILRTYWLETRSGQRATVSDGTEYTIVGPPSDATSSKPVTAATPTPAAGDNKNANANNPPAPAPQQPPPPQAATASTTPVTPALGAESSAGLVGGLWEIDPVLGPDDETVYVTSLLEYHYAPPTFEYDTSSGGEKVLRANAAATQKHSAHVIGNLSLASGATRLLSIWKPEGAPEFEKGDVLQAAFVRVDVVPLEK